MLLVELTVLFLIMFAALSCVLYKSWYSFSEEKNCCSLCFPFRDALS